MAILRYLVSGGSSAALSLAIIYGLTDGFGLWYLFSSTIAFIASVAVTFVLQKYWTFRNYARRGSQKQIIVYLALCLVNVALNALIMHILVEKMGAWYLLAQAVSIGALASMNYRVYKRLIFVTETSAARPSYRNHAKCLAHGNKEGGLHKSSLANPSEP